MDVLDRLDEVVDEYVKGNRFYAAYPTPEMAKMWIKQHRLNTRIRNSVMKLAVATNCPHWDIRMKIIGASAEELIADHEHGEGKAHWQIIEELGVAIGMSIDEIRNAQPHRVARLGNVVPQSPLARRLIGKHLRRTRERAGIWNWALS
jgi:pyrroloquinoline quinone (PQQ) biosynthesis protein C